MEILEDAKDLVAEKIANLPKPEPTIKVVNLKGFGLDGITFLANVSVFNPYAVPIPIGAFVYTVKSAGNVIATGSIPDPGSLKANGDTMLDVTVKVAHSAVVSLVKDIAADWDIDYLIELGMIVDLPVIGDITIPMSYEGEFKLPTFSDLFRGKQDDVPSQEKAHAAG